MRLTPYGKLMLGLLAGGATIGVIVAFCAVGRTATLSVLTPLVEQPSGLPTISPRLAAAAATPSANAIQPPSDTPTPVPVVQPAPQSPSIAASRLVIPRLGVSAPWLPLGYLPNGITMDSPPGPADLGWYTFSAQPGSAGNAVFSGHVDWHTGAPALFAHLASLSTGDEIDVSGVDGALVRYRVVSSTWYPLYGTAAAPIIAPSQVPEVTLITCGGDFDQSSREYDQRLVVRAVAAGG